ncbi:hypothetical protein EV653_6303 [Kribbella pratensis]|uniref:DUF3137 domain-containing protein n=1 Tax=Kribbella pratensis TaxID=2512112 RepID=A0A4R8BWU2_9ACTN|nr:hypothetical protein EV653_6303 [Kribbella pratensis]
MTRFPPYVATVISLLAVLGLLLLTALVAGVTWLSIRNSRRHLARLRQRAAEAARFGWYLVPPNPWLLDVAGRLYRRGRPGETFAGDFRGRGMCAFDYRYTTSSGNSQQTHHVHLVVMNLPVALPPLTLSRHSGLRRSDFELENQKFNDTFRIACLDNRYASAVVHPRLMEWMLYNPGLEWQIAGNALVSWGPGDFTIADVVGRLEVMSRLVDLIPPFVLRDYGRPVFR